MFNTFALALFAGATAAAEWGYPQQYQQPQQSYQPPQQAAWGAPAQQPAWGAPAQQPAWGAPAPQQGYNPWSQQQQQPAYNPWANPQTPPAAPVKPDGWFSVTSQYSPPKIQYVPAQLYAKTFAICEAEFATDMTCTLNIGQVPKYPASVMGQCTIGAAAANMEFKAVLQKLGKLGDACADSASGEEFNPLHEVYNGVVNQYQDPARGRFDQWTLDADGNQTWMQEKLLLNLGGKESIIGKSVTFYTVGTGTDGVDEVAGCCVIGQNEAPAAAAPEPAAPTNPWQQNPYAGAPQQYRAPQYGYYPQPQPQPRYGGYGGW